VTELAVLSVLALKTIRKEIPSSIHFFESSAVADKCCTQNQYIYITLSLY
jgi:hypothetical protein